MIPLAASWSSSFEVLRSSTTALSFSVVERKRLIAARIFDFHTVFRADLRFEILALFSADLCCAINCSYLMLTKTTFLLTQNIKKRGESQRGFLLPPYYLSRRETGSLRDDPR